MNAKAYEKDKKPLVVLMASKPDQASKNEARKVLIDGEEKWRKEEKGEQEKEHGPLREVIWVYMDGDKWGSWLKSMYALKAPSNSNKPNFVIADYSVSSYFY